MKTGPKIAPNIVPNFEINVIIPNEDETKERIRVLLSVSNELTELEKYLLKLKT